VGVELTLEFTNSDCARDNWQYTPFQCAYTSQLRETCPKEVTYYYKPTLMFCRISLEYARNCIKPSSRRDILASSRSIITKSQSFSEESSPSLRTKTRKRSGNLKSQSGLISKDVRYKTRYYNTRKKDIPVSKKLLEPYVLSERLQKLCSEGKVDGAVVMLKNAPLDAQNTPVWNTLIWECMKARRFQLSYQLFVDVRFTTCTELKAKAKT
jgi:hypothetical protein